MPNESPPNENARSPRAAARRLKLTIAYDGAAFRGWQSQATSDTIQDRIEQAFASILGKTIRVHGAGRTDAGVHALGQCAHVDVPRGKLTPPVWTNALNGALPPSIRIMRCRFMPRTFHARFSARGKVYRYRIFNAQILPPFAVGRAWHVSHPLDLEAVKGCAAVFRGRHDFAGFAANRGKEEETVRTIRSVRVGREGSVIRIEFDGEGFLYKMARLMVGAIVRCGLGKESAADVRERLRAGSSEGATRLVAPAGGLTLVRVRY